MFSDHPSLTPFSSNRPRNFLEIPTFRTALSGLSAALPHSCNNELTIDTQPARHVSFYLPYLASISLLTCSATDSYITDTNRQCGFFFFFFHFLFVFFFPCKYFLDILLLFYLLLFNLTCCWCCVQARAFFFFPRWNHYHQRQIWDL